MTDDKQLQRLLDGRAGKLKVKLSKAQVRALDYLAKTNGDWTYGTPVTQRCLNVLHRMGLVGVAYDKPMGGWIERITDAGREAIRQYHSLSTPTGGGER